MVLNFDCYRYLISLTRWYLPFQSHIWLQLTQILNQERSPCLSLPVCGFFITWCLLNIFPVRPSVPQSVSYFQIIAILYRYNSIYFWDVKLVALWEIVQYKVVVSMLPPYSPSKLRHCISRQAHNLVRFVRSYVTILVNLGVRLLPDCSKNCIEQVHWEDNFILNNLP